MDPDERSDEQEEDQGDESAFGLYGVEDEDEGPCGGCQGTWACVVARFRMRDQRIDYLLGPVLLKTEVSFLSVCRFERNQQFCLCSLILFQFVSADFPLWTEIS